VYDRYAFRVDFAALYAYCAVSRPSVRPSVALAYHDRTDWVTWNAIAQATGGCDPPSPNSTSVT